MGTDGDPDAHQKPHRKLDWMGSMRISHIRWTPDGVCMRADDRGQPRRVKCGVTVARSD